MDELIRWLRSLTGRVERLETVEAPRLTRGTAILLGGTKTVATAAVTANSIILLTSLVDGGAPGFLRVTARTAGVSFVIQSSSGTDTSTVGWLMVEP